MTVSQLQTWSSLLVGVLLTALLLAACWTDVRRHRIPNALVLAGMAIGVACNSFFPAGAGFFGAAGTGALGVLDSIAGLGTGFGMFFPLYLIRAMGAGDVKLMAMVGAFLGPVAVIEAALITLVAGGVVATLVALCARRMRQAAANVWVMLAGILTRGFVTAGGQVAAPAASAGKVPYALAIAGGTFVYAVLARAGHTVFG